MESDGAIQKRREVTHNQGSKDWHEWRSKGIGASDVGVIMGENKYKTLYDLWAEKLGLIEPFKGNIHTRRGNDLEPVVRNKYNLEYMCNLQPAVFEYEPWPVLRASLDGIDSIGRHILEIKCPVGKDHEMAVGGEIPKKYIYQVQTQLLVSGAVSGDYVSYKDGHMAVVPFSEDKELQRKILDAVRAFWFFVETKQEPEPAPVEVRDLSNHGELKLLLSKWDELTTRENIITLEKGLIKNRISEITDGVTAKCGYFKINHSERKGSIDYPRIISEHLKSIDTETYRKPGATVTTITKSEGQNEG